MRSFSFPYGDLSIELSACIRRGSGRTLLFLHGGGCAKESFAHAWSHPALRGYSLFALDLAGHGDSTKSDALGYTVREQAGLVMRALDAEQLDGIDLVGHSLGGVVGVMVAAAQPSRFRSFTDVEGILLREGSPLFGVGFLEAEYATFKEKHFPALCSDLADEGPVRRMWASWLKRCDPRAFYIGARSMVELQKEHIPFELYRALRVEKHFVYGSRTPPEFVEKLDGIGELHRIAGADHFPMLENPDGFYRTLGHIVR